MDQISEIKPGTIVLFDAEKYEVLRALNRASILARSLDTKEIQKLFCDKIEVADSSKNNLLSAGNPELSNLSEKDWEIAKNRYNLVSSFLEVIMFPVQQTN